MLKQLSPDGKNPFYGEGFSVSKQDPAAVPVDRLHPPPRSYISPAILFFIRLEICGFDFRLGVQVFVNDVSLRRLEISEELEEDCICDVFTGCGALQEVILADSRGEQACRFPNAVEIVAGDMIVPRLVRTIAVDVLRMMELEGRRLVTFRTNLKHVDIPEGITLEVPSNTELFVRGADKQLVGEFAASVRKIRKPEPYKGKGIRYANETIIRKVGKKAS